MNIKEFVLDKLPQKITEASKEADAAAAFDSILITQAIYKEKFVADVNEGFIVSLNIIRPQYDLWRMYYLDSLSKRFWDEGIVLTKIDFSNDDEGKKEMKYFFQIRNR